MTKGICKYCGQEKELINSHIIPKSLCQIDEVGPMIGINSISQRFDHNPKHQNGQKEPLLCKECDNLIGKLDKYASKVFKQIIPKHQWDVVNGYLMCKLLPEEVDYWMLKKFLISVMWRASVSSNDIHLGKYEDIALKMIKDEMSDNPNFFVPLIYASQTKTPLDFTNGIFGNKTRGKHIYVIRFPHYKIDLIPCIEHSKNPKEMEEFKKVFNKQHIIVQTNFLVLDDDRQSLEILDTCWKNESEKRKNKALEYAIFSQIHK